MGKRLPDDVLNEAVKLRMEGDSYREIAAKLHLRSYTSLEPHLKGVPQGVKKGTAVIEVPVSLKQEPTAEKEEPTRDMRLGPSDRTISAVAEATLELASSLEAFKEELAKRSEESRTPVETESYPRPGRRMTAKMMEDEIDKLKANAKTETETMLEIVKALTRRIKALEAKVDVLMMESM